LGNGRLDIVEHHRLRQRQTQRLERERFQIDHRLPGKDTIQNGAACDASPQWADGIERARERERALRRLARQLAVEAIQTGAPAGVVLKIVREELADLAGDEALEAPVRLTVAARR